MFKIKKIFEYIDILIMSYNHKKFIILLTIPFDEIKNHEENYKTEFNWSNIKNLFEEIYEDLCLTDINSFFYKYNLLKLYFVYYTNYLEFINHEDNLNLDIDKFNDKIKYSDKIILKILNNIDNITINKIIKKINPFNINKNIIDTENFIKTYKQYDKIQLINFDNYKKILNLVIFRYLLVKNSKFNNFNDFYIKNLLNKNYYDDKFLNLNNFIKIIPQLKSIIDLKNTSIIKNDLKIDYFNIVKYFIKIYNNNNYSIESFSDNSFILLNDKIGKIIFEKSDNNINEFYTFQYKLDIYYFNCNFKEFKNYNFIKKSNNLFKIKYENNIINNLLSLLNVFYILTKAFKLFEYQVSDLYEFMFINNNNNNIYYETFYNFFKYIKNNIIFNCSVQKFLIDLIKYLYIYSYYDYYFYNNENLMNTIIKNKESKNEIFLDLCSSIKKLFKLPNELLSYPPFIKNYIFDNILYYDFNEPNYIKFYDLITAIKNLSDNNDININNFTSSDILSLINNIIKIDNQENDLNIIILDDKKNYNTFVELNIENSDNYQLDTEK
jgi:hypothetical protein